MTPSNGVATPETGPATTEFSGAAVARLFNAVVSEAFADAIRPILSYVHSVARNKRERTLFRGRDNAVTAENRDTKEARRWLTSRGDDFTFVVGLSEFDVDHISEQAMKCEARGWKAKTRDA